MKRLYVYADASVIGGCEDSEFAEASLALWRLFVKGAFVQVLSAHTLRELQGAPDSVRSRLLEIPEANQLVLMDTPEADALADAYLGHGIIGPGSRSDALHVALATIGRVDVLVSWNFRHIVNLGKIRLFNQTSDYRVLQSPTREKAEETWARAARFVRAVKDHLRAAEAGKG